ncbi:methyltransferase family protein [Rhodoferax sediminis]|uniref:Isoprenylcysteine carboxylmethyltransferase family protein n=1 Tax=Rhodoferax sediminis TaxID=2509614 RepID=A0A515DD81_9BURK|nr:isoprenylcysteine carboxylmethyltransferase family protein [Rhodoferax sediminis]QDL38364.1 isoprenylcysteine carboxylmethyltransferase family protein [Rhodoferax sediminis]
MQALELKIPPPVVTALAAAAMWGIAVLAPLVDVPAALRVPAAVVLALMGAAFDLSGVVAFRRGQTTVNPMKPDKAAALVCSGVYRLTRNPMYVGLVFVLVAWAVYLSCAWALLGPVAFVLYMNRFQIQPEERALSKLFGSRYEDYKSGVRRWL